ncbi:hypothetical protein PGT21_021426 [Puccinia graminis f. sp. tritici]|uniref:Fido domain-containing protein n=1 Tax=Puccinia graminis f. sp. tritici TaxID=56615 RepID=A0A5B0LSW2_PUCGR|nr:hypothetical protein PGTUg99_006070 [Puccinia graminis f. sp. tritici]KAA1071855.1 hypothetical protein PGT21_021426 [Puccinia graminis f. sp. tritici]
MLDMEVELQLGYKIPTSGRYDTSCISLLTGEGIVHEIHAIQTQVEAAKLDPTQANIITGFHNFFQLSYLQECLIGEDIFPANSNLEYLEKALKGSPETDPLARKAQNLRDAVTKFLPTERANSPIPNNHWATFTPEFLQTIHQIIGYKLISNAGTYRTNWCAPAHEDWVYLGPHLVEPALKLLCTHVRRALEMDNNNNLSYRIQLAASFLTNFLHIHPFSDGNGRVARLAVSWLLADLTIVPIPLTSKQGRPHFLQYLQRSRSPDPPHESTLSRLLLESAFHTIWKAHFSLNLE